MFFVIFPLLLLVFVSLITTCLSVLFLGFILPGTLRASWTWVTISFSMIEKLSAIISSNNCSGYCPGISLFLQSSRYIPNEQPCLKKLDYMMIFYLVCLTFSVSHSVLLFQLVYVFQFLHLFFFFFFAVFLKPLSSVVEKFLYAYI